MSAHGAAAEPAALAHWVEDTTAGAMPAGQVRDVLLKLVSGPECVRAVYTDGRLCAVGVVIDTCDSAADCAELNVFVGARAPADTLAQLLVWGEGVAARGPRSCVDVPLTFGAGVRPEVLEAAGFGFAYALWSMHAEPLPLPASVPEALPGFAWRSLTPELAPALHRTTARAFADVPGSFVPPLEMFVERCRTDTSAERRVLTDGARVAAFLRLERDGVLGRVASLGREPEYRARGLGACALREGLAWLAAAGCTAAELEVAATNRAALLLYEGFGFQATREMPVFRKPLRRP
jgi:ribosomal protein S18 acetylase RimI-like enzyme